jgi:citrate synthase
MLNEYDAVLESLASLPASLTGAISSVRGQVLGAARQEIIKQFVKRFTELDE